MKFIYIKYIRYMEENNNIHKENIEPFKKKIFNNSIKIADFIKGNESIPSLPTIPKIYFNKNIEDDKIGSVIINNYNNIRINIKKLEIIKNFILSILKTSQFELENFKVSKKKYRLDQNNLIINIEDTFNNTFKNQNYFNIFITNYVKENYNIFKNIKSDVPYFYKIFQNEYIGKNKNFFLDLFKKYIKIRKIILKFIQKNNGILGFDMVFEIKDNIHFDKIKNIEKKKITKDNKNYINYNEYILLGENIMNNTNIINNKFIEKDSNTLQEPLLQSKIHKSNLLYLENNDINYYINLHNKRLTNIYTNIITSKNNSLDNGASYNLYNITINLLELEFNIIKFIFNYIDEIIFNNFIDVHIKIKQYIYEKINTFNIYYEPYIEWYNRIILGLSSSLIGMNTTEIENFKDFFNKIISEIDS
jgi:hypothetical protein